MTLSSSQTARISGTRTPPRRRQIWIFASRTMSCAEGGSGGGGGRRRTTRAPSRSTRYVRFDAPSPMRVARSLPEPRPWASRYASSSVAGRSWVASSVMCGGRLHRHDRGRLDLDLGPRLDERGDLDHGHRRVVAAHQLAVDAADLPCAREVLVAVGHVPREPRDVLGPAARLGQDGEDVLQRATHLARQAPVGERAGLVPADLTRDEHERARGIRRDPVRIPPRPRPTGRLEGPHARSMARSRVRCTLPVGVRGRASRNSTRRGYLYGAIRALTCACRSAASASPGVASGVTTTNALTTCPRSSSGDATTAQSATAGCSISADSTSAPEML